MSEGSVYQGERKGFKAVIRTKSTGALYTQPNKSYPPFEWTVGRTHQKNEICPSTRGPTEISICEDGLHWCTCSPLYCLEYIRPEADQFRLTDSTVALYHVDCPTHLIDLKTGEETSRINPVAVHKNPVTDRTVPGDFKRCSLQLTLLDPVNGFFVRTNHYLDYHGAGFKDGLLHSHPLSVLTGIESDEEWILPAVAWHRIVQSSDHYMDFYHHGQPVHRLIKEIFLSHGSHTDLSNTQAYRTLDFFESPDIGLHQYRAVFNESYWFLCLHRDLFTGIVERATRSKLPEQAFHWPYRRLTLDGYVSLPAHQDPDLKERIVTHCRHVMMPYGSVLPRAVFTLWFDYLRLSEAKSKTPEECSLAYDLLLYTLTPLLSESMIVWFRDKKSSIIKSTTWKKGMMQ